MRNEISGAVGVVFAWSIRKCVELVYACSVVEHARVEGRKGH